MVDDSELQEIIVECVAQMYEEAEPPCDFRNVLAEPDDYPNDWYTNHYLDGDRQQEIVEEYAEKYDLSERERRSLNYSAILNYGPTSTQTAD